MEEVQKKTLMVVVEGKNGKNNNMKKEEMKKIKVPIGFRFRPTDEEVVVHYLRRRALSLPLPAAVISDLHFFPSHPSSFFSGDSKEKKYFFWKRKDGELENQCRRRMGTSCGFWKAVGKGKQVVSSGSKNDVVGRKKSWAFYQFCKNQPRGHSSKTRWFMHEFQLLHSTQDGIGEMQENWVVCRVFQRKLRRQNRRFNALEDGRRSNFGMINTPNIIDFKLENSSDIGPPEPSSPSQVESS